MKVLLTGAGGFVGHHVLEHILKNTDWYVVCTDSFKHNGVSARIREVMSANPGCQNRVKVVTHDLRSPIDPVTAHEFGNISHIIHMASDSHVDRSIESPTNFIINNMELETTMLEYAKNLDTLECFIQMSTDEVYGPAKDKIYYQEWSTILPSNPYSASKAAQEALSIGYWRTYDLPIIITNTMNMIGERQNVEKFVPLTINSLMNRQKQIVHADYIDGKWQSGSRFYLHARNQADALIFIINKIKKTKYSEGLDKPEKFNIVGDIEVYNDKMVKIIAEIMQVNPKIEYMESKFARPGHDLRYALDGSKLKNLGWVAPISFEESLKKVVEWSLFNPQWLL